MMLHEAVMLEIYRQALSASELASPRCHSRESNTSAAVADVRCPSNESHCSANDCLTPAPTPAPASPVGLPLPATLAPAAAAALLPPQSAAMAAYLNAAAAAAQQNHLLLTNPLAAAASLVQQATQAHSPSAAATATTANGAQSDETPALDFSRRRRQLDNISDEEDAEVEAECNRDHVSSEQGAGNADDGNSPLDLSVTTRKRQSTNEDGHAIMPARKLQRAGDYKPSPLPPGTWVPPINPYLAAVAAASMSPKTHMSHLVDWSSGGGNGSGSSGCDGKSAATAASKAATNEATKALEKMTEMSRLGAATTEALLESAPTRQSNTNSNSNSNGRHSAWQSHWLNKGADSAKDVFKCVWCKQSFPTLASLTTHMKETQHCGVNVPPGTGSVNLPTTTANNNNANQSLASGSRHSGSANHMPTNGANSSGVSSSAAVASSSSLTATSTSGSNSKSDLNMLIKETMPLPRKLVRGQDVWLGKGAEQTRQILKCMWCGQSFRSLAEMTSHMQETQHYTNIISQEQIISWKSSDDKNGTSNGGSGNGSANTSTPPAPGTQAAALQTGGLAGASAATVSAVLTCKVCEQAFATLKELSNHMVKNNHYKEHMLRSNASDETSPTPPKRGRQPREKRKKSLPVRKLLELERAQHEFKPGSLDSALKPLRDFAASTKITCEKCGSKIETALFVEHIRKCLGDSIPIPPRKSNLPSLPPPAEQRLSSPRTPSSLGSLVHTEHGHSPALGTRADILCPLAKDGGEKSSSTPSVLNAIEQLIEKSFETRTRTYGSDAMHANTPLGSSILKRLGIDDNSDYTKPLMDAQTINFLRSYSNYSLRDRSASESSSISERCNSRVEAYTPERQSELASRQQTPKLLPERFEKSRVEQDLAEEQRVAANFKPEPVTRESASPHKISVKKEFSMPDDVDRDHIESTRNTQTPGSLALSPSASERSATPKSTCSDKKLSASGAGSSLVALSSMFDNLHNMSATPSSSYAETNNNNNNNTSIMGVKKSNANPLAALQKLCDTTDTPAANTRSASSQHLGSSSSTLAGNLSAGAHLAASGSSNNSSMVAFSWACNDAVMTADSIIKCSFCDTPFCSKGAYRHHLSKVHFVKDEPATLTAAGSNSGSSDSLSSHAMKSPSSTMHSPKSLNAASPKRSASRSPASQRQQSSSPAAAASGALLHTSTISPYDESPQSKFLKYTELAKQLSSKNA